MPEPRKPDYDDARTIEYWIGADGSGRVVRGKKIERFGPGGFPRAYRRLMPGPVDLRLDRLPTEPGALGEMLRRELAEANGDGDPESGFAGLNSDSAQLLRVIAQILGHPLAEPDLRSALYRVAGTLDGVEVVEGVRDPSGRPASMIGLDETFSDNDTVNRYELFFDPRTSATLAERFTTTETFSDVRVTFTDTTQYERRAIVPSIDDRP